MINLTSSLSENLHLVVTSALICFKGRLIKAKMYQGLLSPLSACLLKLNSECLTN